MILLLEVTHTNDDSQQQLSTALRKSVTILTEESVIICLPLWGPQFLAVPY